MAESLKRVSDLPKEASALLYANSQASPSTSRSESSLGKPEQILSFLDKEEKELIFLGDANCDFTVEENIVMDSNAKHFINIYELFAFKQLITEPTRVTANSSPIIDHTATTSVRNIVKAGVIPISLSDHFMVFCVRKFEGEVLKDHKRSKCGE